MEMLSSSIIEVAIWQEKNNKQTPTVTLVSCLTWAFGLLRVAAFSFTHAHAHITSARTQVGHTLSDAGRPQCASRGSDRWEAV